MKRLLFSSTRPAATRGAVFVALLLSVACSKTSAERSQPGPSSSQPVASSSTAVPVEAAVLDAGATSDVVDSSSLAMPTFEPIPRPPVHLNGDAGPLVACVFDLPADGGEPLSDGILARAIIPSLDPRTMKAKPHADNGSEQYVVDDCRGESTDATWMEFVDGSATPNHRGLVRLLLRKALPSGREAVWLGTGYAPGACRSDTSDGFFAIVELSGTRLAVLGVTPWSPCFTSPAELRAETLGEQTVYLEPEHHDPGGGSENVWLLRDGELSNAGSYDTWGLAPPDETEYYRGTPQFVGSTIVLTRTLEAHGIEAGYDAGPSWHGVDYYTLRDGKLVEAPPPRRVPGRNAPNKEGPARRDP
jgi:hypothetical protein